jgi:hypothetical protein
MLCQRPVLPEPMVLQTAMAQAGSRSVTCGDAWGLDRRLRCIPRMSPQRGLGFAVRVAVWMRSPGVWWVGGGVVGAEVAIRNVGLAMTVAVPAANFCAGSRRGVLEVCP